MAGGYLWDHFLGDSEYTAREAVVDAAGGALGGSVFRPVARGAGSAANFLRHWRKGSGALSGMTTGEAVMSAGYLYGRPVVAAMPAHARGAVVSHTAGYVYDYISESSASSSSSYQQNGGAGDTYKIPKGYRGDGHNDMWRGVTQEWIRNPCRKGFRPDKIKGAWVCRRGSWSSYIRDLKAGRL